jgi:ATP-dependent exoDNAse (exonuclease V) beta subunit
VRLMTVHKAKGLEFPVVILADMTAKLRSERGNRLIDRERHACYLRLGRWTPIELAENEALEVARDEAEGVRVAYVAATRARDLLVVPGVGDATWDGGWTGPINDAIYPVSSARQAAVAAPGCPVFKKDSVWKRPDDDPATADTVRPGLHSFPAQRSESAYSVTWWDPWALDLSVEPSIGIRRESLIMKDVPESVVSEGLREYETWRALREQTIARGSTPSLVVRTASEWVASESKPTMIVDALQSIHVLDVRGPERPGGMRFGELVHAILAAVPLQADRAGIDALADTQGRILAAPPDERAAASDTVQRVLAHDVLARARQADQRGACRRETPVTLTLTDGTLIEGIVDLAFEENDAWTVVDYKTDRELAAAGEERYRRQIALYASAIAQATGRPTAGVLLKV